MRHAPPIDGGDVLVVVGDLHLVIPAASVLDEEVVRMTRDRAGRAVAVDGGDPAEHPVFGAFVPMQRRHRRLDLIESVATAPPGLQNGICGEHLLEIIEGPGVDEVGVPVGQLEQSGFVGRRHRWIVTRRGSPRKATRGDHYTHPVLESALIEAVQTNRVGDVASRSEGAVNAAVVDACAAISARLEHTRAEIEGLLEQAGIPANIDPIARFPQRYALEVSVDDLATAEQVGEALAGMGFEPWERWTGAAQRSFERYGDHRSFARTNDATTVARVRWRAAASRTTWQRLTWPTPGDWHAVDLPRWAWRAYPAVRLTRLVLERIDPRRRYAGSLGPFLTTSDSLLDPLLDLVDVGEGSRVIDLGCGDGRLVVAAAARGAEAIGLESDVELVERARRRAAERGVVDRTTFVHGDARTAQLDELDVVFAFLPVEVIGELVPRLLARMRTGAVLLVHEQNRLPVGVEPAPDSSDLVVGSDAVTVAHRWWRPDPSRQSDPIDAKVIR